MELSASDTDIDIAIVGLVLRRPKEVLQGLFRLTAKFQEFPDISIGDPVTMVDVQRVLPQREVILPATDLVAGKKCQSHEHCNTGGPHEKRSRLAAVPPFGNT